MLGTAFSKQSKASLPTSSRGCTVVGGGCGYGRRLLPQTPKMPEGGSLEPVMSERRLRWTDLLVPQRHSIGGRAGH